MGHDQRFKDFLYSFLQEFLELFFPEVAKRLDFRTVEFLDKEVFTEAAEGSRREADVVAKLRAKRGRPEILLIHIEVQSRWRKRDVPARMYQYHCLLSSRYRLPIFPIAVYLRGGGAGIATEEYRVELYGREVLRFRYDSIRLARLSMEEYREKGGPAGAALAALMDRASSSAPEALRASLLRRIARSRLDEARQLLLVDLVETYFQLTAEQKERYRRLVSRKEYRDVQDVEMTWAERLEEKGRKKGREEGRDEGRDEGRQEGIAAGRIQGKREAVLRVLSAKFRRVPKHVVARVEAMDSAEELDACLERISTAQSLKESGLDS
ncbi:MAG TPA: hypothetical protein VEK15_20720 [Vicinamibacteria bacterium]|nr:hypothetical protein [Vicinamibacteria bacterium]